MITINTLTIAGTALNMESVDLDSGKTMIKGILHCVNGEYEDHIPFVHFGDSSIKEGQAYLFQAKASGRMYKDKDDNDRASGQIVVFNAMPLGASNGTLTGDDLADAVGDVFDS